MSLSSVIDSLRCDVKSWHSSANRNNLQRSLTVSIFRLIRRESNSRFPVSILIFVSANSIAQSQWLLVSPSRTIDRQNTGNIKSCCIYLQNYLGLYKCLFTIHHIVIQYKKLQLISVIKIADLEPKFHQTFGRFIGKITR